MRARGQLAGALVVGAVLLGCSAVPVPRRLGYHTSDADVTVTRIVHGTVILDVRGTRLLVDPWFHSGVTARQREPLGLTPDALPPLAAVLLTHGHGDRFDTRALRDLAPSVPVAVAPRVLHDRLVKLGFRQVTALEWWDEAPIGGVTVSAVPARHAVPENGYVVAAGGVAVYVGGDARYSDDLAQVAARFPHVDVALLSIGGERLLGFQREMGPKEAARAAAGLDARRVVPVGYGERGGLPLRWFARRPVERFVEACARLGIEPSRVVVLETGESWHYYRAPPASSARAGRTEPSP